MPRTAAMGQSRARPPARGELTNDLSSWHTCLHGANYLGLQDCRELSAKRRRARGRGLLVNGVALSAAGVQLGLWARVLTARPPPSQAFPEPPPPSGTPAFCTPPGGPGLQGRQSAGRGRAEQTCAPFPLLPAPPTYRHPARRPPRPHQIPAYCPRSLPLRVLALPPLPRVPALCRGHAPLP